MIVAAELDSVAHQLGTSYQSRWGPRRFVDEPATRRVLFWTKFTG
jgi:hypothetical protein